MNKEFMLRDGIDPLEVLHHMHDAFIRTDCSLSVQISIIKAYAYHVQYDLSVKLTETQIWNLVGLFQTDVLLFGDRVITKTFIPWVDRIRINCSANTHLLIEDKIMKKDTNTDTDRITCINRLHLYLKEESNGKISSFDLIVKLLRDYVLVVNETLPSTFRGILLLVRAMSLDAARTSNGLQIRRMISAALVENILNDRLYDCGVCDYYAAVNTRKLFDDSILDNPVGCKEIEEHLQFQVQVMQAQVILDNTATGFCFSQPVISSVLTNMCREDSRFSSHSGAGNSGVCERIRAKWSKKDTTKRD
jgi:hypothetical protein